VNEDFTIEAWIKPSSEITSNDTDIIWTNDAAGTGVGLMCKGPNGTTSVRSYFEFIGGTGSWTFDIYGTSHPTTTTDFGVWHHIAGVREKGTVRIFIDGVCCGEDTAEPEAFAGDGFYIGGQTKHSSGRFIGFMDGIRFSKGIPRYTSGRPRDGQTPHKEYDDGRSSNTANSEWTSSGTRKYYGINTHTYLQTTKYATDANTTLLLRGDDALTAEDGGVNMYGRNGWHLKFKDMGAGTERDHNSFNNNVDGLGSDSSTTSEFADDKTMILVQSRPNQAHGSSQFIDEVYQRPAGKVGRPYNTSTQSIFGVDSNTANVSVASGGTGDF